MKQGLQGKGGDKVVESRIIHGYYCKTCNHTIFSRARHDFRVCLCWRKKPINEGVAVDGGTSYFKVMANSNFNGEQVSIKTKLSDRELYDDWNHRHDRWGLHEGKISKLEDYGRGGRTTRQLANDPVDW